MYHLLLHKYTAHWFLLCLGIMCHTHCDTGLPFLMVIFEDPWHSHLLLKVLQWSCHYLFYDLGLSRPRIEPRSSACKANVLPLCHRGGEDLKFDCIKSMQCDAWANWVTLINTLSCLLSVVITQIFFTNMETSPLPMKGCKFWLVVS